METKNTPNEDLPKDTSIDTKTTPQDMTRMSQATVPAQEDVRMEPEEQEPLIDTIKTTKAKTEGLKEE